jgi:hypothetical protein
VESFSSPVFVLSKAAGVKEFHEAGDKTACFTDRVGAVTTDLAGGVGTTALATGEHVEGGGGWGGLVGQGVGVRVSKRV